MVFCGSCGEQIDERDTFCGGCGAVNETAATQAQTEPKAKTTLNLSWKANKKLWIGGGVAIVLLAAYLTGRALNGPSSNEALQTAFSEALRAHDTAKLAKLIDPNQQDLLDAKVLEAFKNSLDESTTKQYLDALQAAAAAGGSASTAKSPFGGGKTASWMNFVSESGFFGTRMYVHLPAYQLQAKPIAGDKISLSVGGLTADDGKLKALWPSRYDYQATISNDFASEKVEGQSDILKSVGGSDAYTYELDLSDNLKTSLYVKLPKGITMTEVTLNGKPLKVTDAGMKLRPAPAAADFKVKATVLGVLVEGDLSVDAKDGGTADLFNALKQGIAKKALDAVYDTTISYTKVATTGDDTQLKGVMPTSSAARDLASNAKRWYADHKTIALEKIMISPSDVSLYDDTITVSVSEFFRSQQGTEVVSETETNSPVHWDYHLKQASGKAEWLVDSLDSSWNHASRDTAALTKANSEAPTNVQPTTAAGDEAVNAKIRDAVKSYETSLVQAINQNDFAIVEPFLVKDSALYKAQKDLVANLNENHIKEELVSFDVQSIEKGSGANEYKVTVKEKTNVVTASDKSTKEFTWVYTVVADSSKAALSEIAEKK